MSAQALEYVKICPKCATANPEAENTCLKCGFFLGMVQAVPPPKKPEQTSEKPAVDPTAESAAASGPLLFLDHEASGRSFQVKPGQTVGQAHETGRADVPMSGLPNLNYVSREHCRFDFKNGAWFVNALTTALNGTRVNGTALAPGGRARVRNGDEVILANLPFRVRTVAS